jgi:hypothetical protein
MDSGCAIVDSPVSSQGISPGESLSTIKIRCADCDSDHVAHSPRAKYCSVCRLFRDFAFVQDTTKNCFMCEEVFAPVSRKDALCSICDYNHKIYGTGTCGICKTPNTRTIRTDISVCLDCARKPGATRRLFIKGIAKRRRERMETPFRFDTVAV